MMQAGLPDSGHNTSSYCTRARTARRPSRKSGLLVQIICQSFIVHGEQWSGGAAPVPLRRPLTEKRSRNGRDCSLTGTALSCHSWILNPFEGLSTIFGRFAMEIRFRLQVTRTIIEVTSTVQ